MTAFAHSDPEAVVYLSARLADGAPLPGWLRLDPATGAFIGVPPQGFDEILKIEVIARDTEGREARTQFELNADTVREGAAAKAAADFTLGLDVDKEEAKKAKAEAERNARESAKAEKPALRGTQTFSEQMKVAKGKADPLLDKILGKPQDKPRPPR